MIRRFYLLLFVVLLALARCGAGAAPRQARWTVLIYMSADNELDKFAMNNLHEMESVAPLADAVDAGVTILVQLDRANTNTAPGTWTDTRRYRIVHDPAMARYYDAGLLLPPRRDFARDGAKSVLPRPATPGTLAFDTPVPPGPPDGLTTLRSPRLDNPPLGELDMGDPKTLHDFVLWGQRTAPAEHYLLVTWGHGCGWTLDDDELRDTDSKSKSFCEEYGNDPDGTSINSAEISQTLAGAQHIDVLAMDNCMMAMLEVGYQVRKQVDYLVASEEEIPDRGFYYPGLIDLLTKTKGKLTAAQLATFLAGDTLYAWQHFGLRPSLTMSVMQTQKLDEVTRALDQVTRQLLAAHADPAALGRARAACKEFGMVTDYIEPSDIIDLDAYLQQLEKNVSGAALHRAIELARHAIQDCVSAHATSPPYAFAQGISIYCPPAAKMDDDHLATYGAFDFCRETGWMKFLKGSGAL